MQFKAKITDMVMKAVDVLIGLLMASLVILIFFQVLNRFILHIPAAWTEEMGRYNFVWLSLFGSVKALQEGAHLSVDIIVMNFKGKKRIVADIIAEMLTLVFSIILLVTGYTYTLSNIGVNCEFGEFPLFLIYMAIPITGFLLCVISIEQIFKNIKNCVS